MSDGATDEDRLFEEAVDILIRIKSDPDNPVALEIATRWLARSPQHREIWEEALEIHGMTGKILTDKRRAERKAAFSMSRRSLVVGGMLGGGALLAAGYSAPGLILQARADVLTSTAEIKRVELSDGSVATLGPDSAIAVKIGSARRDIELIQGMAFFEVARDSSRPFAVRMGSMVTTALGTAFDVSDDGGFLNLSVSHGTVQADLPPAFARPAMTLQAGDWLSLSTADEAVSTGTRDIGHIATWRNGMIVVEKERVAAVVARVARWKRGRVMIADPGLGNRPVSGVYDLSDPSLALEAVVQPYGGKVRELTPYLTVISAF
ncbi:iron dicitrate transporter FecR [Rhizobium wenxiniae]|uniref:Transmembrane sensor n=1 Tax=Rhizobium wenxiniae TaxID=1737357 RepID=A0A7X0D2V7_9HYPH|nr:FecR domain-containing protein [Rhizobium wenxiniae]MBB6166000.1 transmembrane sensor [Rhizobium wenxiniae]GGG20560.1 iron dicitrate transporter FecR [Rhizobium wenxiniae]